MELYDSEEQQVEAIKDWWKENGKAVVLGVVVGLGGLFGWRYYQDSVVQAQEAASEQYSKAVESMVVSGVDASADMLPTIRLARSNKLLTEQLEIQRKHFCTVYENTPFYGDAVSRWAGKRQHFVAPSDARDFPRARGWPCRSAFDAAHRQCVENRWILG